jgi:hypothetical protein
MKSIATPIATAVLLVLVVECTGAETTKDYAVMVSAAVQEDPPQIALSWPSTPSASVYYVYRKAQADTDWGAPIAVLDGGATGFTDTDVAVGEAHEYSVRMNLGLVADTVQVAAGTPINFTIYDAWGDGICCNLGLGYYEVSGCGTIYASGGDFGDAESVSFIAGEQDSSCIELIVFIQLDFFGTETIWALVDESTQQVIAEGGPYDTPRFGHILAGIRAPAVEERGTALLAIEQEHCDPLSEEINRLETDLIREGYHVRRLEVPVDQTPQELKERILDACDRDSSIAALLLFGHVPVPYSGDVWLAHRDHQGAWPADAYYGDLDGVWTDSTVTNTTASRRENHNVPGDGKFDQTLLPSDVDLQVGRVDLSDLPVFSETETELLRRYLDKNHAFRSGQIAAERRGVVDDNVGPLEGTAFAATGWRNFAAMFGAAGVEGKDYFSALNNGSYLWSYGCGGSSYTHCGGVGRSLDFARVAPQTVFTILYGSYFGDWDNTNNVLRAPLASEGPILTNLYGGKPAWHLHRMALGETIGHCARLTQNNNTLYTAGYGSRQIHIALMGDPTLRMHVVAPPRDLHADSVAVGRVKLRWKRAEDVGEGYRVYRSDRLRGQFHRIASTSAADTTYEDASPLLGANVYMVRTLKLETSGSGTYHNLSPGAVDSTSMAAIDPRGGIVGPLRCGPNPFRSESTICYVLRRPGTVSLRIYDVCGSLVRTLHDGLVDAGEQHHAWDGRDDEGRRLPSGVYLCALTAAGSVSTGSMILVR